MKFYFFRGIDKKKYLLKELEKNESPFIYFRETFSRFLYGLFRSHSFPLWNHIFPIFQRNQINLFVLFNIIQIKFYEMEWNKKWFRREEMRIFHVETFFFDIFPQKNSLKKLIHRLNLLRLINKFFKNILH